MSNEESSASKVLSIGTLFLAYVSEQAASYLSDQITMLGLDGRIDILAIIFSASVILQYINQYCQYYVYKKGREDTLTILQRIVNAVKTESQNLRNFDGKPDNRVSYRIKVEFIKTQYDYILNYHVFIWRQFLLNIMEFLVLLIIFLATLYTKKMIFVFTDSWSVSAETSFTFIIPVFLYVISLKTEFLSSFKHREDLPMSVLLTQIQLDM